MKMFKKNIRLAFVLFLVAGLLINNAGFAAAAKLKSKTIKTGSSVNVKVKGKAKWKISNGAVARLTVLSKKKAQVTGLQAGKTKVTAKVGKKKYTCTITVKDGNSGSAAVGNTSSAMESIQTQHIAGSQDSYYYLNTGVSVVGHFDSAMANELIAQTNSYRSSSGVGTLRSDALLNQAAQIRAYECSVLQSHTRPNGTKYFTVGGTAAKNYNDSCVFGENLAWGFSNASSTMSAWKNSPTHSANLVRSNFGKIGIAVFWAKQSDGRYSPYIAQEFG